MDRIEAENDSAMVVVAALRSYASARRENEPVLPAMVELAGRSGLGAPAAVALTSVFELTETCLGRRLLAREDADAPPTTDEAAMLMLIANVGYVGSFCDSAAMLQCRTGCRARSSGQSAVPVADGRAVARQR